MKKLLCKELCLTASPLSFVFTAGALLTLVPGYPILLGAFFTTLGIFYSFQTMRENNDIGYTLLLPVSKADVVRGKYAFVLGIEMFAFVVMTLLTLLRMTRLKDAAVYVANALMCANLSFLGFALLIFGLFNFIFLGGFFKTAYYYGRPFIAYCVVTLVVIFIAEAMHYIPGLAALNCFGFEEIPMQCAALIAGTAAFALLTVAGLKKSIRSFETIDL